MYVPVLHTKADMGSLAALIERIKRERGTGGALALKRSVEMIDKMWDVIEQVVNRIPVEAGKTRVYQDGLPVCGREREMVRELAAAGSRNHKLLVSLEERGATLMGTESPELLIEEYHLAAASAEGCGSEQRRRAQASAALLEKRDRFIAGRIDSTLQDGETGILFIGMLHTVDRYLARDIRIEYPVNLPVVHPVKPI